MNNAKTKQNPWFTFPKPNANASLRLFCLPYAGGGGHIYIPWKDKLASSIELCSVQLPGRGMRMIDAPITQLKPMIDALVRELTPLLSEKPYALFGHSMGALLCYELTRQLSLLKKPLPTKIFASGRRAPSVIDPDPVTYNLPHDQFIQELDRLNGTPKEVLQNAELMELLMPTLRADFELCETYEYQSGGEVPCSITAIGGIDDDNASEEELEFWCDHTSKEFKSYRLPGDHFFLHSAEDELLKILHDEL